MSKLWKARLGEVSDEADGPDLSLAHQELEKALGGIFGIPDKIEISEAIFSNPDVSSPVTSSGEIFMIRYKSRQPVSSIYGAPGIQFYDTEQKKRLAFVNGTIQIWKQLADNSWEQVIDLELVEEPEIKKYEDVDFGVLREIDDGKVIAVSADPALFTLVDDAVPVSGAQNFNELADVENAKWDPPYYEYTRYASAIKGHAAMVGDTEKIWPAAIEDPGFWFWAKADPIYIPGPSSWKYITGWVIQEGSHEDATVEDLSDDFPGVYFPLSQGIYKINLQYSVPVSDGLIGETRFLIGCGNCHKWPPSTASRKAKHFYFDRPDGTPPPLQQTMVRWTEIEVGGPGVDEGQSYIVVPGDNASFLVRFRQVTGFGFSCRPMLSVSRIN